MPRISREEMLRLRRERQELIAEWHQQQREQEEYAERCAANKKEVRSIWKWTLRIAAGAFGFCLVVFGAAGEPEAGAALGVMAAGLICVPACFAQASKSVAPGWRGFR